MDIDLFEYSDILNAPFQAFNGSWEVTNTHWHYFTEILYLKEGELEAEVLGTKYYLKPGDLIIFHPKQIHAFRNAQKKENLELIKDSKYPVLKSKNQKENDLAFTILKYHETIISNINQGTSHLSNVMNLAATNPNISPLITSEQLGNFPIKTYIEDCLEEVKTWNFGFDVKVSSYLNLILTKIIRIWLKQGLNPYNAAKIDNFSNKQFSVLEYIDQHSSENISVEDLADKCGMCYSNFAKQFKAQFGRTCKEYIEFIRICKADTLLLYTDKTLDYISQETGFTDSSHFIRTYKKIKGVTPKQRRMAKK